mmetsp:Transcript_11744/g.15931  ORF Transcript_11744/g.15931 Transcript_11744/m.15931 type:complete len:108 (+) Transcript_11744:38-361(+)
MADDTHEAPLTKEEEEEKSDGEHTSEVEKVKKRLNGLEFLDDGELWRIHTAKYDPEHETIVVYYHDASIENADIDDCEYSSLEEVDGWVAKFQKRLEKLQAKKKKTG